MRGIFFVDGRMVAVEEVVCLTPCVLYHVKREGELSARKDVRVEYVRALRGNVKIRGTASAADVQRRIPPQRNTPAYLRLVLEWGYGYS